MHTLGLLDDLKAAIAAKSAVIVVGTGVSLAVVRGGGPTAAFAGWQGLLESGLAECLKHGLISPRTHDFHVEGMKEEGGLDCFLHAATTVEAAFAKRQELMTAWLNATVGKLPCHNPEIIDALGKLGVPILTTNYDTLIANRLGRNGVPWTNVDQLLPVARGDAPHILHLHGVYAAPHSVVLGWASYNRVAEDSASTLLKSSLATMKTFIFVGCGADGLNDPDLGPFFNSYGKIFSNGGHFRLCLESEAATTPHGITSIRYAAHGDLVPLLRSLAPLGKPAACPIVTNPTAPYQSAQLPDPLHRVLRGRGTELTQAIDWMVSRKAFAVIGLAGMGKSALSLEALRSDAVAKTFGDRRWFVRLDAVKDANTLLSRIGQEMGMPPDPGRPRVVMDELAEKGGAIVLDNAEDPLKADRANTEQVLAALAGLPNVALAVGVRGTDVPAHIAERLTMKPLDDNDARAVFLDLAGGHLADDPDLGLLLGRMEGMPLPLYLLGRKASDALDIRWLLTELDGDGKRALRFDEGRQYDLTACINVSVPNKGPMRQLLSLLGQLPDGIGADDLGALVGKDGHSAAEEAIAVGLAFWDRELRRVRTLAPIREHFARAVKPRPKMLERCRQFILERLRTSRHDAYPILATETGNLEAMLVPVLNSNICDTDASAAINYGQFHRFTGLGQGIILLEHMMKQLPPRGRPLVRANSLWELSNWNTENLRFELSEQQIELALRLFKEQRNANGLARCILDSGRLALHRGDIDKAEEKVNFALKNARRLSTLGNCEYQLGELRLRVSQLDVSVRHLSRAREHFESDKGVNGLAHCRAAEGEIARRRGDITEVTTSAQAALLLYRRAGDIGGEAHCHLMAASAALEWGDWAEARKLLSPTIILLKRASNLLYNVDAAVLTARLALTEPSGIKIATEAIAQALSILAGKGIPRHQAQCLCVQGEIALARQDWADAETQFIAAIALFPRHRGDDIAGDCLRGLGDAARAQGQMAEAREAWDTAIDHYGKFPNPHWIAQIKLRLARLAEGEERAALVAEMREVWRQPGFERWLEKLGEFQP
ncbi:MAG: SIR2 family protein [Rhodospirillaceae bacterium]|nr:SIR2 family protein [Rhodospirillales bacterium]